MEFLTAVQFVCLKYCSLSLFPPLQAQVISELEPCLIGSQDTHSQVFLGENLMLSNVPVQKSKLKTRYHIDPAITGSWALWRQRELTVCQEGEPSHNIHSHPSLARDRPSLVTSSEGARFTDTMPSTERERLQGTS